MEPFPGGGLITLDKFYHGCCSYLLSKEQKCTVGIELHFLPITLLGLQSMNLSTASFTSMVFCTELLLSKVQISQYK